MRLMLRSATVLKTFFVEPLAMTGRVAVVLLLLLLMAKPSVGAELSTAASVYAYDYDLSSEPIVECSDSGAAYASCSNLGGSAVASAQYGGVYVGATVPSSSSLDFSQARAWARAEDRLTMTGGTGSALLQVYFQVGAMGTGHAGLFGFGCSGRSDDCPGDIWLLVPFTFDVPLDMIMVAEASGDFPPSTAAGLGGGASLEIVEFSVVDSGGNPIPNVRILAESGTRYPSLLIATPEPSGLILLAASLGLLFWGRRRRRSPCLKGMA